MLTVTTSGRAGVANVNDSQLDLAISTLQAGYCTGQLSPIDVVNHVYDRIESFHDKAVWIHLVPREEALVYAKSLAEKYASGLAPPLFGVPFSVKDSLDVAGIPTTLACPSFAYTPVRTAPVVQKVLDAGGIMIGKTNLDQFATGLVRRRSPYGTPRCVFDSDYISGGSSSGGAVSVGAHLVTFAIATDTAGSTRVPSTLNGVIGLKPTLGTLSTVGLIPACKTADCITVIARSVNDAKAAWDVMKGFDDEDVYARETLPPRMRFPSTLRFGIPPNELLQVLSPAYASLYSQSIEAMRSSLGWRKTSFDYTPFQLANNLLYGSSIVSQRLVAFDEYLQKHGMEQLHPVIRSIFQASSGFDAVRAYKDTFDLATYKRRDMIQFREIDVLVVPSTVAHFTVAEIDEDPINRNKLMGSFTHFVNLLDLCAISVPTGSWKNPKGNDMPFGVTLIAEAGRDEELMGLGNSVVELFQENPITPPN
jgi:allophanate hydrolase